MSTLILPFAIINVIKNDNKSLALFNKTIIFSLIIIALYSIFLLSMPGVNPYMILINPFKNGDMDADYFSNYYAAEDQGRLFGRISSVFIHPMTNGLILSLSFIYTLVQIDFKQLTKQRTKTFLIFITLISIISIGVRTAIGATAIGVIIFLILNKNFKLILYSSVTILILIIVLHQIPEIKNTITSIIDPQSTNTHGSSIEMRINQFNGCLNEIKTNYLFGKGYNWTSYYTSLHGSHPVMLSFESLVIVILCNNGIAGIFIWLGMIMLYLKNVFRNFISHYPTVFICILFTYLTYSLITGEYNYLKYFLIFYSILWMNIKNSQQNEKLKYFIKKI